MYCKHVMFDKFIYYLEQNHSLEIHHCPTKLCKINISLHFEKIKLNFYNSYHRVEQDDFNL